MPSDADLVRAVARGEGAALAELCERWERPLYRFLHRSGAGDDADDLFQETWLRIARAAERFDGERRFSTWLFQIALNLTRDLRRRRVPAELDPADAVDSGSTGRVEAALDARRLLESLPEPQRDVLLLRLFADRSEEECAEILGCPKGTVKSRFHLAVKRLSAQVRGPEEEP